MSAQTNFNKAAEYAMKTALAKQTKQQMCAINNLPHSNSNPINTAQWTNANNTITTGTIGYSPSTITTTGTGNVVLGGAGQLYWNNDIVATRHDRPSVSRLSDMLKDSISREIILCKDKEECKVKYGEYGLKLYESFVAEVIQEAIKSEEAFLMRLQQEHDKIEKLKDFIREHVDKETALKALAAMLVS